METENLEAILQHCHCTLWIPQEMEKEKGDHHYQQLNGKTGHNNLLDQTVVEPVDTQL